MGDHRASVKIEFYIHNKTYKTNFDWINYWPNQGGIDSRIADWFEQCWEDAYSRYQEMIYKASEEQRNKEIEIHERKMLEELKAKYEQ